MSRTNSSGLRRDLELLDALATHGELGVTRVAQLVGREKTQVSRALASLADEGLVERDPDTQGYRLGWRLYALAARTGEARLVATAGPYLRRLVGQIHETAHLCVLRGGDVLTLLSESPAHAFRGVGWEGVSVAVPATSAGRVLISDWEPSVIRDWFPSERLATARAVRLADTDALLEEIGHIRARGYATVDEEFEVGVVGCSAPVRDFRGRIVAAINVAAPKGRLGDKLDAAGRLTAKVAAELTARLACPPSS
ncbi:IclR family transcriptional regulator [Nonomuraea roseoviolacea subsp. roseoviolacea]|uniref:DNA-binding IclR family transcriptional regulator n=1 Tax=Nonomuraea roseoviolacea subsp. carminata TaxID=160689 RepID=A0ABT1K4U6_9ACTN|nr:IclR family transcriptional regulator [Nonomuraea roseoviolacea]MCP2349025.1 DNA-binding IclR family transcriptional regulator [Nonomuraea roseoviolacea subsp. carminata]